MSVKNYLVMSDENNDFVVKSIDNFFDKYPDIKEKRIHAVAVSGGPDSMALAYALSQWCVKNNIMLHVLTVDHGLREESKREAQKVAKWVQAQSLENMAHHILTWEGDKPENAIMEEARDARYALMAEHCKAHNIKTLFVAHHQDDQAETFLIRLAKGSGLDGLAGMDEVRQYDDTVNMVRPFLSCLKQNLIDFCEVNNVDYIDDPSNENTQYLRPRLRKSMEVLNAEGLTSERLETLTRRLGRAREALEEISQSAYDQVLISQNEHDVLLNFTDLKAQPEEIAFRVVQRAVQNVRDKKDYGVRMDRLENLFESLWQDAENFKPRTLGGLIFALKDKNTALYIKKETV